MGICNLYAAIASRSALHSKSIEAMSFEVDTLLLKHTSVTRTESALTEPNMYRLTTQAMQT
eukprot:36604-Eustigmatos_ZCMA.PRE.1